MKKPSKKEAEVANAIERFKTMPAAKVREELARRGINAQPTIDAVKAIVAKASATLEERTPHPKENALRRVFLVASVSGPTGTAGISWQATHAPADRLRDTFRRGGNVRSVFCDALDLLGEASSELRKHDPENLDATWPLAEAVVETGSEVARDVRLWEDFATWFADTAVASAPSLQCTFVHALRQLYMLGPAAGELATLSALETLRHAPAPEARMLLIRFAHHNDPLRTAGRDLLGIVDGETRRTFSEIDAAKHDALTNFPKLRMQRAERGFFGTTSVATLMDALRENTLSRFLAMEALAEVYLCAATLIAQDPKPRQKEQHAVFASRIAQQLRDEPRFLAIGSIELVRDRYPRFAALLLASLVDEASQETRMAIFVCIAGGYERSFRGVIQERTPSFELDADAPSFRSPAPHELDVFGHRVCESAAAEELRPNMRWLNQRLERWARAG